ncbi:MAG TPA: metalloregulator ArsR/SmtB family transcription factor [Devosia sp.]|jgi:DNA-binding transcriptional ArsR family regulator|uniref:ArsR/SmtB family transcription factor n=1 Tax=Devosia sp. TaxID=1871048 RepID=UPI002F95181C
MNTEPVFAALSHPVRRRVVTILLDGEKTAGSLAVQFDLSRSAVSEHLGILRQAGLVVEKKSGRERFYSLNAQPLVELRSWLAPYEAYWKTRLNTLARQIEDENK